MLSRQRNHLLLRKARGQCQRCGGRPLVNNTHCDPCRLAFNARYRRLWRKRSAQRRCEYHCSVCKSTEHNRRACPVRGWQGEREAAA